MNGDCEFKFERGQPTRLQFNVEGNKVTIALDGENLDMEQLAEDVKQNILDINKKLNAKKEIKPGDRVRIVNTKLAYEWYAGWVYDHIEGPSKCHYCYGAPPRENTVGIVEAVELAGYEHDALLAYVNCSDGGAQYYSCYLVDVEGLEKVVD